MRNSVETGHSSGNVGMLIHSWTKERDKDKDKKIHNIFMCREQIAGMIVVHGIQFVSKNGSLFKTLHESKSLPECTANFFSLQKYDWAVPWKIHKMIWAPFNALISNSIKADQKFCWKK